MKKFNILKDMDGVETSWDDAMEAKFEEHLSHLNYQRADERKHWEISDNYDSKYRDVIKSFYFEPGFFFNLKPMPGAIESTEWMIDQGYNVTFCTTPLYTDDVKTVNRCIDEKREYLYESYKHLIPSKDFFHPDSRIQFIPAYDKTLIHGHVLIDDKPKITGCMNPTWKHLLFYENYPFSFQSIGTKINWDESSKYFYQPILLREYKNTLNCSVYV